MYPPAQVNFNWQGYGKGSAHPNTASHRNMTAEFLNNTVGYKEPEARTFFLGAVFRGKKRFKNMAYDLLRYTFTIINYINLN
jgi:hypothetical protein